MNIQAFAQKSFGNDTYVVGLVAAGDHGIVASVTDSSGASLHLLPLDPTVLKGSSGEISRPFVKGHTSSSINAVTSIDNNVIATCGDDGLKIWDLRLNNNTGGNIVNYFKLEESNADMLCIDSNINHQIAVGTQLVSADAGVVIWDVRTSKQSVAYIDSHSDDVTDISFHPSDPTALLSGSVDGLVNIYNTAITDEDEAVYQVINHGSSIHKARFLPDKRILALSHMETLAIYTLADPDSDLPDPKPNDFGDVRTNWACQYVADLLLSQGYIGIGSNSEENSEFRLLPFDVNSGKVDLLGALSLQGGHGEEIVRAVHISAQSQCVYTGGEDGIVKVWKPDNNTKFSAPAERWGVEEKEETTTEDIVVDDEEKQVEGDGQWEQVKTKKEKKHNNEKNKVKKKKDKIHKQKDSSAKKNAARYEPY